MASLTEGIENTGMLSLTRDICHAVDSSRFITGENEEFPSRHFLTFLG